MAQKWYVIRSKPNKEFFLADQLKQRNINVYLPTLRVKPVNPRSRKIVPYFPGYMFVDADFDHCQSVIFDRVPGSQGLVVIGGEFAFIAERILNQIQVNINDFEKYGIDSQFKSGEMVSITQGAFKGYSAIYDISLPGRDRAQVLLTLLRGRQVRVSLPVNQISKSTI